MKIHILFTTRYNIEMLLQLVNAIFVIQLSSYCLEASNIYKFAEICTRYYFSFPLISHGIGTRYPSRKKAKYLILDSNREYENSLWKQDFTFTAVPALVYHFVANS